MADAQSAMSHPSNQKPAQPEKQPDAKALNRIPVRKIWFLEPIDFPAGNANTQVLDCTPPKVEGRARFVAHFVPAHQVIEIEFYAANKPEPERMRVPLAAIKRFDGI